MAKETTLRILQSRTNGAGILENNGWLWRLRESWPVKPVIEMQELKSWWLIDTPADPDEQLWVLVTNTEHLIPLRVPYNAAQMRALTIAQTIGDTRALKLAVCFESCSSVIVFRPKRGKLMDTMLREGLNPSGEAIAELMRLQELDAF